MSNVGFVAGQNTNAWKKYEPRLRAFGGSPVQHAPSDERNLQGRWLLTNQGLVKFFTQITFAAGDTLPSGETFCLAITLPYPANRSSGGADLPIGTAMLWQGPSANPSPMMIGQVSLADAVAGFAAQGEEDKFCQVFLANMIAFGGPVDFASGATTATVTHGLPGAPAAYDIKLTPTNVPSTNTAWYAVQNVTATTFDIVIKTSSTTTPAQFYWKIEALPSSALFQLMGSRRPWTWAAGHSISIQGEYEARR